MSSYAQGQRTRISIVIALLSVVAGVFVTSLAPAAAAQESPTAIREAGKHFQRGVTLYGEADYRAALVEFKRAYATAPNVAVLYNVGEAEYQLQDYASALTTFERYIAEASPSESHRAEVESTLDVLRARVGHLSISTVPPGADVTVDDQAVGKTPFEKALLVSIGRRKVVASMAGRAPVSRYVDVAADDNVSVSLQVPNAETNGAGASLLGPSSQTRTDSPPSSGNGGTLRAIGWIVTGASAAGAATFGVLAMRSSSQLESARGAYPTSSATLAHDASLTTTYSLVADSLTVAAILVGGVTLYSTLASSSSSSSKRGTATGSRLSLGPASARFEMTF